MPHKAPLPTRQPCRTSPLPRPPEPIRGPSIAGAPAQARATIDARHAAGATSAVLAPAGPDPAAALDSLARALPDQR
ncbi:hypothetical protein QA942_36555 [Streptomyces sp. B21-106]|uniref:hypothetical protein n=1 Tax=Streptomyces sp. B21-106 TaxID=3039418 RepID=UPI002FF340DE